MSRREPHPPAGESPVNTSRAPIAVPLAPTTLRRLARALRVPLYFAAASDSSAAADTTTATLPEPAADTPARSVGTQTAVFAGACFWGVVDARFKHVKGVTRVVSGYAAGSRETAIYEEVGTGRTGHAEAVEATYDPAVV